MMTPDQPVKKKNNSMLKSALKARLMKHTGEDFLGRKRVSSSALPQCSEQQPKIEEKAQPKIEEKASV